MAKIEPFDLSVPRLEHTTQVTVRSITLSGTTSTTRVGGEGGLAAFVSPLPHRRLLVAKMYSSSFRDELDIRVVSNRLDNK